MILASDAKFLKAWRAEIARGIQIGKLANICNGLAGFSHHFGQHSDEQTKTPHVLERNASHEIIHRKSR